MPKISGLPPDSSPTSDDYLAIVDNTGTVTKRATLAAIIAVLLSNIPGGTELTGIILNTPIFRNWDGWIDANETWQYASASTITVPNDGRLKYAIGDKIKFTQSATVKYGYVASITATVMTIAVNTDYVLTNNAITANYYSHSDSPVGHPLVLNYAGVPYGSIPFVKGSTGVEAYSFSMSGRKVFVKGFIRAGGTGIDFGTGGQPISFPLPISISAASQLQYENPVPFGILYADDTGNSSWLAMMCYNGATTASCFIPAGQSDNRLVVLTTSHPFGPNTGDSYKWSYWYEC